MGEASLASFQETLARLAGEGYLPGHDENRYKISVLRKGMG